MKTAKELGISRREQNAMIKVRDGLRGGTYRHVKESKLSSAKDTGQPVFNISHAMHHASCGTAGCIGGWMAHEMRMSVPKSANYVFSKDGCGEPIEKLFYPWEVSVWNWDKITPKRAAKAIDNFLNTGDPQWSKVVPA